MCFPLAVSSSTVCGVLHEEQDEGCLTGRVAGYTTNKTRAAGAAALRVKFNSQESAPAPGAYLVTVRVEGQIGALPGLAAPKCGGPHEDHGTPSGVEIVVFGRPDASHVRVMYLPEEVLRELYRADSQIEVRLLRPLLPVQHDCPEQWLRDRLLRLADGVEGLYQQDQLSGGLQEKLEAAGLKLSAASTRTPLAMPADYGDRVSEEERGYWDEEMRLNTRCDATMNGEARLDGPGLLPSFPGIQSMI